MAARDGAPVVQRSRCMVGVVTILVSATLAACGSSSTTSSAPAVPKLTITAGANGFTVRPTTPLPAGTVELHLRNDSPGPVQFKFGNPLGATTLAQVQATVRSGALDQLQREVELGLGWSLPPTQAQTLFLTYRAGINFVLSLISTGPNAPPQAAQGFLAQFKVQGTAANTQPQPAVAGTLTVTPHSISVPSGFGKGTFAMVNADRTTGHELTFFRFTGGSKPLAAVVAAFASAGQPTGPAPPIGPPPFVALGLQGLGSVQPLPALGCLCIMGSRVLGTFAMAPGEYVVVGTGVDPKTNAPEVTEGIVAEFTVA